MRLPIKRVITDDNSFTKRIWLRKVDAFFSSKTEFGSKIMCFLRLQQHLNRVFCGINFD